MQMPVAVVYWHSYWMAPINLSAVCNFAFVPALACRLSGGGTQDAWRKIWKVNGKGPKRENAPHRVWRKRDIRVILPLFSRKWCRISFQVQARRRKPCMPELKGSIGKGSNHSNFSHQSSVKILRIQRKVRKPKVCQNSMHFARNFKKFRMFQHFRKCLRNSEKLSSNSEEN